MEIRFKGSSRKELTRLDKNFQKRIVRKISLLSENPFIGKKLEGEFAGARSVRVWPYRVIYKIEKNEIAIYTIRHRQGAYN